MTNLDRLVELADGTAQLATSRPGASSPGSDAPAYRRRSARLPESKHYGNACTSGSPRRYPAESTSTAPRRPGCPTRSTSASTASQDRNCSTPQQVPPPPARPATAATTSPRPCSPPWARPQIAASAQAGSRHCRAAHDRWAVQPVDVPAHARPGAFDSREASRAGPTAAQLGPTRAGVVRGMAPTGLSGSAGHGGRPSGAANWWPQAVSAAR